MTPETQAAAERVRAYLEARRLMNAILRQEDTGTITSCRNVELGLADLQQLLTALDTAEPIDDAKSARQLEACAELQDITYELFPDAPYAPRHQPLTDEPCGVIPTPRGRQALGAYRDIRQQQHPRGADQ